MNKNELIRLLPQQKGHRGFNPKPAIPKLGVTYKPASEEHCILDGQTFSRHSKKNMTRHIFFLQKSFIESQKGQSDLRLVIGKYEKEYGKLKEEKKVEPKKKKETKPKK